MLIPICLINGLWSTVTGSLGHISNNNSVHALRRLRVMVEQGLTMYVVHYQLIKAQDMEDPWKG